MYKKTTLSNLSSDDSRKQRAMEAVKQAKGKNKISNKEKQNSMDRLKEYEKWWR